MSIYGQFCPVAKAAELLGERWTLLIVRELVVGATRFSELQNALSRASPTIIAKRLKQLQADGLVERYKAGDSERQEYRLTAAGRALEPLIVSLGTWSAEWITRRIAVDELDEYLLMTDVQRRIAVDELPAQRAVIRWHYGGKLARPDWWLVIDGDEIDLCDTDPGREVDLNISTTLRCMTEIWMGYRTLNDARRSGRLRCVGSRAIERSMHRWLGYSLFARNAPASR